MKRKKGILMAALMMAVVSMMSFVSASEEETIVIEGELANVPDSIVLSPSLTLPEGEGTKKCSLR
ncbi:MAG: hypothetical protein IJZ45_07080 [Bacteroidaceae bacterium]|nr:hypothetical protein [Bacteroidaceae bacterium]